MKKLKLFPYFKKNLEFSISSEEDINMEINELINQL